MRAVGLLIDIPPLYRRIISIYACGSRKKCMKRGEEEREGKQNVQLDHVRLSSPIEDRLSLVR